jgi:predicted DNA-binding WGR domain protein
MTPEFIIDQEWAGHCREGIHDKVWAVAITSDGHYFAVWGRRDTKYQSLHKAFASFGAAERYMLSKVDEKLQHGYNLVSFNDTNHGSIPSFSDGELQADSGSVAGTISAQSLTARLKSLASRLPRAASLGALSTMLMELSEINILATLFTDLRRGDDIDALAQARKLCEEAQKRALLSLSGART